MDEKELYNRLCDIEARLRRLEMLMYIAIGLASGVGFIQLGHFSSLLKIKILP